ncbi:hypothetical protein HDV03_001317 [Kappamyces sp. JEL0829]|nr:hypothetical protein HDV03_001317 [Kappamyces sp. JEL0829]
MTKADLLTIQSQVLEQIFDCDKKSIAEVAKVLDELQKVVKVHNDSLQKTYLVDDTVDENELKLSMSPKGLSLLQKHASPWLVALLRNPPRDVQDESEFMDRISYIMSLLCGKLAAGETSTKFEFANSGVVEIKETTFTEAEIGFQTWGAGILLANMIDQGKIDLVGKDVLELGSGTGLAGLVSGRVGSRITVMTDYHPTVIANATFNIGVNSLAGNVRCIELDWRWFDAQPLQLDREEPILRETDWKHIIAADCIFDLMHSRLVPKVAKHYLSRDPSARFYCLLPHRLQFQREITTFEANMEREGWIMEHDHWIHKMTLTFRYYVFRLPPSYHK